jgi:hypothetical protein
MYPSQSGPEQMISDHPKCRFKLKPPVGTVIKGFPIARRNGSLQERRNNLAFSLSSHLRHGLPRS